MKVGDLIKHATNTITGTGLVTKVSRNGPPGCPVYVTAMWSNDWLTDRSIEQQYLEVISELSDEQLDVVCGGMSDHAFGIWKSKVINESW